MYIEKPSILETCSEMTKVALRLYCDYINRSHAEIYVIMAQKAFCLFQILFEEGLIDKNISTRFFSSTALEFGFSDFQNKKIAIVDDIIISGSAIASVANKLVSDGKINEENIEIIALARDLDYQTMHFTSRESGRNLLKCALDVPDAECIELSYEISHILAYRGRPYDADFPVYTKIELNSTVYKQIMASPDWMTFDVSNDIQRDGNIQAITLFPNRTIRTKLWKLLGINLSEFMHLKIRGYIQHYECNKDIMEIVPMVLFKEVSEKELDALCTYFIEKGFFVLQKIDVNDYKTKLRILQFYIAHVLKTAFTAIINGISCTLVPEIVYQIFGPQEAGNIIDCLKNIKERENIKEIQKKEVPVYDMEYKAHFKYDMFFNNGDEEGFKINQVLYQAIQYGYETKELTAREALIYPERHFLQDYDDIAIYLQRLHEGFSLNALLNIFEDSDQFCQVEQLVSLFIDRGVDEGIVVPAIYHNKKEKYVCRVYRHGEDLPFGDADKSRLLYFLQCLNMDLKKRNGNKEEIFSSIAFEKIFVLFYQIGLKGEYHLFNRFLGFDNYPIIQQRFSVHGAISTYKEIDTTVESRIFLEAIDKHAHMLNVFFVENEYVKVQKANDQPFYIIKSDNIDKYIKKSKLNNISKNIKLKIKTIASVIGAWYYLESTNNFRDDITALTSCKNIYTYASAAATSLHYFKLYWEHEALKALDKIQQGDDNTTFYSKNFDKVLPSGRKKYEWFINNTATTVIDKVEKLFDNNEMKLEKDRWIGFWKEDLYTLRGDYLRPEADIATQYIFFYSICYEWLRQQWFLKDCAQESFWSQSENANEYLRQINLIKAKHDYVVMCSQIFSSIMEFTNYNKRIDILRKRMCEIVTHSEDIVNKIEDGIREHTATYRISYTSVLIIDVELQDSSMADEFFLKVWNNIRETEEKTYINIFPLEQVDETYFRYGIFHEEHTDKALQSLMDIYDTVHQYACYFACKTRAILIPMLRYSWVFEHDLKAYIPKYANTFVQKISSLTSKVSFNDFVHQFYFVPTWTTSGSMYENVKKSLKDYTESEEKQAIFIEPMKVSFDCYQFVCGKPIDTKDKTSYSTIPIKVNNVQVGTGILFCYKEEIYCITCQHLLEAKDISSGITGIIDGNQRINLSPLNYSEISDRTPWEDILILKPEIRKVPELDRKYMFNIDNCIINDVQELINEKSLKDEKYKLYGFGSVDPTYGCMVENIRLQFRVTKGYYQMKGTEPLGPGYSGAAIVPENTLKLLGIHVKSLRQAPQQSLMIPAKVILDVLERIYKKMGGNV